MSEHEYTPIIDVQPNEVFFKVARVTGGIATGSFGHSTEFKSPELNLAPAETEDSSNEADTPLKIEFDHDRHKALVRAFPEFKDMSDDEIRGILSTLPHLIERGRGRFHARHRVEDQMRILYSWLGGKTTIDLARVEGLKYPSEISMVCTRLLGSVRKNFSWDEIVSGKVVEITEEPEDLFLKGASKMLHAAYPEHDFTGLSRENYQKIMTALASAVRPQDQRRLNKVLEGLNDRQIAESEGLKTHQGIWEWRRWIAKRKLRPAVGPDSLLSALQSEDPEAELKALFAKITFDRPARKRTAPPRRSPAPRSQSASYKSGPPAPEQQATIAARSEDSKRHWDDVRKELEAFRNRKPLIGDAFEDPLA